MPEFRLERFSYPLLPLVQKRRADRRRRGRPPLQTAGRRRARRDPVPDHRHEASNGLAVAGASATSRPRRGSAARRRPGRRLAPGHRLRRRGGSVSTDTAGAPGGMEVCEGAAACHRGSPGAGAGQIGSTSAAGALGLAVTPDGSAGSGTVYLADTANRRVNTYDLDGTSPASFGSSAQFGASSRASSRSTAAASSTPPTRRTAARSSAMTPRTPTAAGSASWRRSAPRRPTSTSSRRSASPTSTGDTFTLTCPGGAVTDPITYKPSNPAAAIDAALEAKCGPSFSVSGSALSSPSRAASPTPTCRR